MSSRSGSYSCICRTWTPASAAASRMTNVVLSSTRSTRITLPSLRTSKPRPSSAACMRLAPPQIEISISRSTCLASSSIRLCTTIFPLWIITMRSHTSWTSSMTWLLIKTERPPSETVRLSVWSMNSRALWSRPLVGSSQIRISGSWTRAQASLVACFIPVLNVSIFL